MLIAQLITIALLYYQVTMPAVENGKYHPAEVDGKIYIMNTQNLNPETEQYLFSQIFNSFTNFVTSSKEVKYLCSKLV